MRSFRIVLLACVASIIAASPPAEPPTLMTERGKLLFSDDQGAAPGPAWKVGKGKWEVKDGAVVGAELKSDKHGAVIRHTETFRNAVIQFSFKLDGAKTLSLSLNAAKSHLNRVVVTPTFFRVLKDDFDHDGPDKAVVLQTVKTKIAPGEWHTVVLELYGPEMLASLDGEHVAFGANDLLDADKANFGFTVSGESAAFKDVRVWEAQPNAGWEKTKAKLLADGTKSAAK
jgi:hypothetical protein